MGRQHSMQGSGRPPPSRICSARSAQFQLLGASAGGYRTACVTAPVWSWNRNTPKVDSSTKPTVKALDCPGSVSLMATPCSTWSTVHVLPAIRTSPSTRSRVADFTGRIIKGNQFQVSFTDTTSVPVAGTGSSGPTCLAHRLTICTAAGIFHRVATTSWTSATSLYSETGSDNEDSGRKSAIFFVPTVTVTFPARDTLDAGPDDATLAAG
mmetsp:Transcript_75038/g.200188  ORF Transcript_75038/g.200188 Transcript_75038/m.200188 type:complete len:210 (+) Transcript_75038:789-1418(+)